MKEKKAITRKTLIGILLVLFSAAVILFFLVKFGLIFRETIDKETCHNSALLRASVMERGGGFEKLLDLLPPLRCKTQYSCLSMGGECPEEKYGKIIIRDEKEIKNEIANAMYDCWWMVGEGIKIFPGGVFEGNRFYGKSFCVICSVISFSEDVQKKHEEIKNIIIYLDEKLVPGKNITYSEYISLGDIREIDTTEKQMIVFKQFLKGDVISSINVVPYNIEEIEKLKCQVESIP